MASTRWRLNITANNGLDVTSIQEVVMRATPGGADQCVGGTASAETFYGAGFEPSLAFDDADTTRWSSAVGSPDSWIEYEFAAPVEIVEYSILPHPTEADTRSPKDWTLEYYDGTNWRSVDIRTGETVWVGGTYNTYLVPADTTAAWLAYAPRSIAIADPPRWGWLDYAIREFAWVDYAPRAAAISDPGQWAWKSIAPASQWALPAVTPYRDIYICTLRKTGFDDVEVPMSSLQLRRRDGNPTLVSAVVPDAMTYLDYAEDRKGGEIIIEAGKLTADGTRHLSELQRASLETVKYDHGVGSSSLTIEGYKTETNTNPRPVDIEGISYEGLQSDGKTRIRGKVDIFLRPGDTAIYSDGSIVVEQIYVKVEAANSWMEVAGL